MIDQNPEDIRDNIVKIVDKNGKFYGTGFFLNTKEKIFCLTCHHCIYELNEIYIEWNNQLYPAQWIEEYSIKDKDIAYLLVNDCPVKPLKYTSTTRGRSQVYIWGFPGSNIKELKEGQPIERVFLSATSFPIFYSPKDKSFKGIQKWNEHPEVYIKEIFQIEKLSQQFGGGYSGSPVCLAHNNFVTGMISFNDNKNNAFVIPIETILERLKDKSAPSISLKLSQYLNYCESFYKEKSSIDEKSLSDYYIPNNVLRIPIDTWTIGDTDLLKKYSKIDRNKILVEDEDFLSSFLDGNEWITIIGAPFGIGKTSLSYFLAFTLASKYRKNPIDSNYIPILILLKDGLVNINEYRDLNFVLTTILGEKEEGSNKKILIICNGLHEYNEDIKQLLFKLKQYYLENKNNTKIIITTLLKEDLGQKLLNQLGQESLHSSYKLDYIRLLPFSEEQIKEFFNSYYGINDFNHKDLLKFLGEEEARKPLFCWMLASMKLYKDFIRYSVNQQMAKSLIYLHFLYSIKGGKPQDFKNLDKKVMSEIAAEKNLMRKIAVISKIYSKTTLKMSIIIEGLKKYGIIYPNANAIKSKLDPILTSYFDRKEEGSSFEFNGEELHDFSVSFIHKSFEDYFIAEYYLESILHGQMHYLSIGVPSMETISFLDGLLELLDMATKDTELEKRFSIIAKSFNTKDEMNADDIKKNIIDNASEFLQKKQVVINREKFKILSQNENWYIADLLYFESESNHPWIELFIHHWISLYILNKLNPKKKLDNKVLLAYLISFTSHSIPSDLKNLKRMQELDLSLTKLNGVNLSGANLSGANLSGANLSGANLSGAQFSTNLNETQTDFSSADLSGADLSGADLSNSNLSHAMLSAANLSNANLTHANLSTANMSGANLSSTRFSSIDLSDSTSGANLSNANLCNARLIGSRLSNTNLDKANLLHSYLPFCTLINSKLTSANLSGADLSNSILSGADLSNANLSDANLSCANFAYANISDKYTSNSILSGADLSNANLSDANLSCISLNQVNMSKTNLHYANLSNTTFFQVDLSEADLSGANLKYSIIIETDLSGIDFSNSDLSYTIIIRCNKFRDLICNNTKFFNTIVDSKEMVEYLEQSCIHLNYLPKVLEKEEIVYILKTKGYDNYKGIIEYLK